MAYVMHQFMFWGWKSCTDEPNGGICPIVCIIRKTSFWWVAAACLEEVRHFWPSVITADTPALGTGLRLPDGDRLLVLDLIVDGEGVQDENLLEWISPGSSGKDPTWLQVLTGFSKGWYRGVRSQPGSAGRVLSSLGSERIAWEKMGAYTFKIWVRKPEPLPCWDPWRATFSHCVYGKQQLVMLSN